MVYILGSSNFQSKKVHILVITNDVEVTRSEITLSCNSRACKSGPQDLNVCLHVHLPALPVSVCLCYHATGNF